MNASPEKPGADRGSRTLIKAFSFAGAILGIGLYGLVRVTLLFGGELGWFRELPALGAAYWWLLGGAGCGFLVAWTLVRARRNKR